VSFFEINFFGVYVAPIVLLMLVAWIITEALQVVAAQCGLLRRAWHPALFVFATYLIVLSSIVLMLRR
jgi:hypothetical protein